jgi:ubiquinone/menaquinone biosynthesis C-methylase UbiE
MLVKQSICPVCKEVVNNFAPTVISPWIRKLGVRGFISYYFLCQYCETGHFSKRYDQFEMNNIYGSYRGEAYVRIRAKWEPWYSEAYNQSHDSEQWVESRKSSISKFLRKYVLEELDIVVDVGGGAGEFIPDIAKRKIVLEVTDKNPLPNIIRISNLPEFTDASLILYSHVLEHVSDPELELKELLRKTGLLYVEVPFGVPEINNRRKNQFEFFKHFASSFIPSMWRIHSQPSTGRVVSGKKMLTQSEHLTFFSEKSIRTLAANLHADVVIEKNEITTPDFRIGTVFQCLFTKAKI